MDKTDLNIEKVILPEGATLQMGKYRIDKFLSSGGFSIAYKFNKTVAIKVFYFVPLQLE